MSKFWLKFGFLIIAACLVVIVYGSISLAGPNLINKEEKITQLTKQIANIGNEIISLKEKIAILESQNKDKEVEGVKKSIESLQLKIFENAKKTTFGATRIPSVTLKTIESPIIPAQPQGAKKEFVTFNIAGIGIYDIEIKKDDTAFDALLNASKQYKFSIKFKNYEGLGTFIECIGGICGHDNWYWALYYNGTFSQVGISSLKVKDKDLISLVYETW